MNVSTPASQTEAHAAPEGAAGTSVAASRVEEFFGTIDLTDDEQDAFQLRSLNVIVASGARLVQRMEEQIVKADWINVDGPMLFETLAKTVRRTIALQRRISADRRARHRGRITERKAQVRQAVTWAIDAKLAAAAQDRPDRPETDQAETDKPETGTERERLGVERENLLRDLDERLDDPEFERMVLLPVYETVKLICREMKIPVPEPWADRAVEEAYAAMAARTKPPKPPPLPSLSVPWRPPFVSETDPPTPL